MLISTGIKSNALRSALSVAENNEEEDAILRKFDLSDDDFLRDNRGRLVHGSASNTNDNRGTIHLWGSVVQKYRGYVRRNNGPYFQFDNQLIGYDKSYHYDENLNCEGGPPWYPAVEQENESNELNITLSKLKTSGD